MTGPRPRSSTPLAHPHFRPTAARPLPPDAGGSPAPPSACRAQRRVSTAHPVTDAALILCSCALYRMRCFRYSRTDCGERAASPRPTVLSILSTRRLRRAASPPVGRSAPPSAWCPRGGPRPQHRLDPGQGAPRLPHFIDLAVRGGGGGPGESSSTSSSSRACSSASLSRGLPTASTPMVSRAWPPCSRATQRRGTSRTARMVPFDRLREYGELRGRSRIAAKPSPIDSSISTACARLTTATQTSGEPFLSPSASRPASW